MATSKPPSGPENAYRYPLTLLGLYVVFWAWMAIAPWYRQDWLLENVLVFVALPLLVWSYPRLRFSRFSCTLLFVFFVMHTIGSHYTYAEVPYDRWFADLTGHTLSGMLGLGRNHYDRLVHLAYGLLVTPAAMELLDRRAPQQGIWRWLLPITFMASHTTIYELLEWLAAGMFGGELGQAYLGTQGDVWDAHKDMLLATMGAIISVTAVRLYQARHGKPRPT
jgi:putative membrane protein